ncbi:MAG: hypothetical protein ACOCU1_02985 [Bacillota bacterium]
MKRSKEIYERPQVDIVVFELEDSIATSADNGSSTTCSEGIFE